MQRPDPRRAGALRDDLVLVSKVGADRDGDGRLVPAQRPAELRAQVEANLASLGAEQIGVVNLRRLDAPPGIIAEGEQLVTSTTSSRSSPRCATRARSAASGSATSPPASSTRRCPPGSPACRTPTASSTGPPSPSSSLCRAHGVAWVPFFPLGSAVREPAQGDGRPDGDRRRRRARRHPRAGRPRLAARALREDAADPGHVVPAHLAENLAAGAFELPAALATLDRLAPDVPRKESQP